MKKFNVYKHPTLGSEAVKVGFAWPALFFGLIWLIVKQIWVPVGIWIGGYVAYTVVQQFIYKSFRADQDVVGGFQAIVYLAFVAAAIVLWLIAAFKGNKWREGKLSKRGYTLVRTVQAETPEGAIAIPDSEVETQRKCPYCAETIKAGAIICRFCNRDLPKDEAGIAQAKPFA